MKFLHWADYNLDQVSCHILIIFAIILEIMIKAPLWLAFLISKLLFWKVDFRVQKLTAVEIRNQSEIIQLQM